MKTFIKRKITQFDKIVILASAFIAFSTLSSYLLEQDSVLCDVAELVNITFYLLLVWFMVKTKISFTYERTTKDIESEDDLDSTFDDANKPLYMHPSHKPYHNAKIGGRLCEMCGTHASSRRAKEWCPEVPPPRRKFT